ncbi:MAG: EAL domain-containing protein [Pseudomonadota bacterium]
MANRWGNGTSKLTVALTVRSVLLLLFFGALLAAAQALADFRQQRARVAKSIDSVIASAEATAREAVFLLDPTLAEELIAGLAKFEFFFDIALVDDQEVVLARYSRADAEPEPHELNSITDALTLGLFNDHFTSRRIALRAGSASGDTTRVGELRLVIDNYTALGEVIQRARTNFAISLAGYSVFCLALGLIFHRSLASPLLRLAERLQGLDISKLEKTQIEPVPGHTNNELGAIVDATNDMLERIAADQTALSDRSKRTQLILDSTPSLIFSLDQDLNVGFANRAAAEFYGCSPQSLSGSSARGIIGRQDPELFSHLERFSDDRTLERDSATKRLKGSGRERDVQLTLSRFEDSSGAKVLVNASDISERVEAQRKIEVLAYFDQLTGLPNRNSAYRHFDRPPPGPRRRFGIAAIADVDRFRRVNDTMGNSLGDGLIMQLAQRFKAEFSELDLVARSGDDEFLFIQQGVADSVERAAAAATQLGDDLRACVAKEMIVGSGTFTLTASVGVVTFDSTLASVHEVLRCADTAVHEAKHRGRNRVALFQDEMATSAVELLKREHDARRAIAAGEFFFLLQPIFCAASGRLESAEALLRWRSEDGQQNPADFIPFLEESGLILDVGYSVLNGVCAYLQDLESKLALPDHFNIAVNISARQLLHPSFIETVEQIVRHHALRFSRLQFEITESLALDYMDEAVRAMQRLNALGIGFSLDDFGTGYSSLCYLKDLPVDKLKLDRSFILDIEDHERDATLVRSVMQLASNLGYALVAEGVETREQADWLSAHGDDLYFQGFYFSRPISPDDFETRFLRGASAENPPHQAVGEA